MTSDFSGTFTALVTPFRDDDHASLDLEAFERHVEAQIAGGITGVVPCGTTGESPSLDHEEQLELVRRAVSVAKGKALVVAGTGTNSTRTTVAASKAADRAGADAIMVVVPYYNKPTQEGLIAHFVTVAKSVSCPVVLYNVPARTGIDLLTESIVKICDKAPNVVAVKDATGNVLRTQEVVRALGARITVLSGDDGLTLPMIAAGARGVISVTSNLYPFDVARVTRLALDGHFEEARRAHFALLPVHEAMFLEANPSPVKAALAHEGRMLPIVRGPLARLGDWSRQKLIATLATYQASRP